VTSLLLLGGFFPGLLFFWYGSVGQPVMLVGIRGTQRKSPSVQNFHGF